VADGPAAPSQGLCFGKGRLATQGHGLAAAACGRFDPIPRMPSRGGLCVAEDSV